VTRQTVQKTCETGGGDSGGGGDVVVVVVVEVVVVGELVNQLARWLVVVVSTLNGTRLLLIARSRLRRDTTPVVLPRLQQACKEAVRERPSCHRQPRKWMMNETRNESKQSIVMSMWQAQRSESPWLTP
jgi:hypothetical protein